MVLKLLPLQGDRLPPKTTQGDALGYELLPFQGVLGIGLSLTAYHKRIASALSGRVGDRVISENRLPKDMKGKAPISSTPWKGKAPISSTP